MTTTSKYQGTVGKFHRAAIRRNGELRRVLASPQSKDYADLRDRAAFLHVTGTLPTHLRAHMTSLLRSMTVVRPEPTSLDGQHGSMKINPLVGRAIRINQHPMVLKTKEFLAEGYLIAGSRDLKSRRPFSRVFLYRDTPQGQYKMTVHSNGAIQEGWDGLDD